MRRVPFYWIARGPESFLTGVIKGLLLAFLVLLAIIVLGGWLNGATP